MPHPLHPTATAPGDHSRLTLVNGGANLIVVPGSMTEPGTWLPVAEGLSADHRVWLLDRTTVTDTGGSVIDVLADIITDATLSLGGTPAILAHSSGAICVLRALIRRPDLPVSRVILYEPPLPVGGPVVGDLLPDLATAIQRHDLESALRLYLNEVTRFPAPLVDRLALKPRLQAMLPALLPELHEIDHLTWTVADAARITSPTLLLLGELSAEHPYRDATLALASTLPDVELATLPGHGHLAHHFGPADITTHVRRFLTAIPHNSAAAA